MTKIQRQQAAWKVQEEMEIAAEQARLERLATYVDEELKAKNEADEAKAQELALQEKRRIQAEDTKRVIVAWEEVAKTDLWELEKQMMAATKKKQEEELETALDRFYNILSTRAKIRQEIENEMQRMAGDGY